MIARLLALAVCLFVCRVLQSVKHDGSYIKYDKRRQDGRRTERSQRHVSAYQDDTFVERYERLRVLSPFLALMMNRCF